MSKGIILAVASGIGAGFFLVPRLSFGEAYLGMAGKLVVLGLSVLLFFVGFDIGRDESVVKNMKAVGLRVIVFPLACAVGTLAAMIVASFILPLTVREAMAVGAGFGWYSLAPSILMDYSAELSAISFLHNVMRELFAIMLIPIVAKRIGYIECIVLPGAAAMDVCLPIVERATNGNIAVYSFVVGVVLSMLVPWVGMIVGI